jgi:colanic acid biosynthesis glycosyl transferase WcaI
MECSTRRLILINRFFYPDHSATGQIASDLAFYLAEQGEDVSVITSRQRYDKPGAKLLPRESVRGVKIYRIKTTRFGRYWLPGRAIDYFSFYFSAGWQLLWLARRGDVSIAMTDPPILSVLTSFLALLFKFKAVNWLQDLYPELGIRLGVPGLAGFWGRRLIAVRNLSLRVAKLNIVIGRDMERKLRYEGLSSEKLCVISNWADDRVIAPEDIGTNALRLDWGLQDKFVVAYSGNLGRAHDVETVLGAAERLSGRSDIVFLFIGGGRGLSRLQGEVHKRKLSNLLFRPYQRRSALSQSLGVADVHWLSLKDGLDGLLLPSKFYGIAAAGRPIIVVGSMEGELAGLVTQYNCGAHVALGQSEDMAIIILRLAENRQECRQLGGNARRMLEDSFTKDRALKNWYAALRSVTDNAVERQ